MRLILAWKQRFSLDVSSSERGDEVIKILRPMKASRFNLWPASHLVIQDVCRDLTTLKLHIMYVFCTSVTFIHSVIPGITMRCLLVDERLCSGCASNTREVTALAAFHMPSTAALHSEETIRTNCSRVQQSKPHALIYEANHLRAAPSKDKTWTVCAQNSQRCGCMQGFYPHNSVCSNKLRWKFCVASFFWREIPQNFLIN